MTLDRKAAIDYARTYWNRVADDEEYGTASAVKKLADARRTLNAPAAEGWEGFFVSDGQGTEKGVFRPVVGGRTEEKPQPFATWAELDDCTHYVSRCLIAEGVVFQQTARANELAEAMMKSASTKTLAVKTDQIHGQKIVDSGLFKPGDLVAYWTEGEGRYTHTAMFVGKRTGKPDDPGGITCHTMCRFEGLSEAWNGASDDDWRLSGDLPCTLIHFSDDDPPISVAVRNWLPGWWQVGQAYYLVADDGRAHSTVSAPGGADDASASGGFTGYYFERDEKIVFIWRNLAGRVRIETWTPPSASADVSVVADGAAVNAARLFV